ncbi:hypothetical protein D3C76_1041680 [compost metagenome]
MTDRLDLPALGNFLRHSAPSLIIHDDIAPGQRNAEHQLDATRWLERLADVLGCSPAWLIETGRVTAEDLATMGPIGRAARLIRSYGWEAPPAPAIDRFKQTATHDHGAHRSAETATPEWRHARDQYLNHIMACRACYAPRARHCLAGADLRASYENTPMASHHA